MSSQASDADETRRNLDFIRAVKPEITARTAFFSTWFWVNFWNLYYGEKSESRLALSDADKLIISVSLDDVNFVVFLPFSDYPLDKKQTSLLQNARQPNDEYLHEFIEKASSNDKFLRSIVFAQMDEFIGFVQSQDHGYISTLEKDGKKWIFITPSKSFIGRPDYFLGIIEPCRHDDLVIYKKDLYIAGPFHEVLHCEMRKRLKFFRQRSIRYLIVLAPYFQEFRLTENSHPLEATNEDFFDDILPKVQEQQSARFFARLVHALSSAFYEI